MQLIVNCPRNSKKSIKIKVGQAVLELIQKQHFDCFDL